MVLQDYILERRRTIMPILRDGKVSERMLYDTPYKIVGSDIENCLCMDSDFLIGLLKHLGLPIRELIVSNKECHIAYAEAIFDMLIDFVSKYQSNNLDLNTWLWDHLKEVGVIIQEDNRYIWAELDFKKRVYYDLITRPLISFIERYARVVRR